ncbi:hypothetical protein F5Y16DRAFT_140710 [Xylariaceae sp. FL0255]|nr:hypothetical protein F5Y16DRAFT_140710 [Xylariaceae sp. FL0255]
MPKRQSPTTTTMSTDLKGMPPNKIQKTERSHEENQERAYIAASRRADRSLEARVQSAKMASEIHRRRTGRGLKVSEEIVVKEEMYEEEEDDMPRAYKLLASHLQTASPEFNSRVSAYISAHTAMATLARYNEVSKIFDDQFRGNTAFQQQMESSQYMAPLMRNPPGSTTQPNTASPPLSRHQSITGQSRTENQVPESSAAPSSGNGTIPASPAPSSRTSVDHSGSKIQPTGTEHQNFQSHFSNVPLDPQLVHQPTSSFTSELPNEVKMLANIDMSDPMAMNFFGEGTSPIFDFMDEDMKKESLTHPILETDHLSDSDVVKTEDESEENALFSPAQSSVDFFDAIPNGFNQFDSQPFGVTPESWESLVNYEN